MLNNIGLGCDDLVCMLLSLSLKKKTLKEAVISSMQ